MKIYPLRDRYTTSLYWEHSDDRRIDDQHFRLVMKQSSTIIVVKTPSDARYGSKRHQCLHTWKSLLRHQVLHAARYTVLTAWKTSVKVKAQA